MERSMYKLFAVMLMIFGAVAHCFAATITVDNDAPADYTTIQAAIDAAADGDEIVIADGTYTGDGNRDIDFHGKEITVKSQNGPQHCIIDCQADVNNKHRGFIFQSNETQNSILQGFTIINGYGLEHPNIDKEYSVAGGILIIDSSPVINNCIIENCFAENSAALYCQDGNPSLKKCIFQKNDLGHDFNSGRLGGTLTTFIRSDISLTDCIFSENSGRYNHPIYFNECMVKMSGCRFTNNTSELGYSVIYSILTDATITDCLFENNYSEHNETIVFSGCSCVLTNCVFRNNTAGSGDWASGTNITILDGDIEIIDCLFEDNVTNPRHDESLIQSGATMKITGCRFIGNHLADRAIESSGQTSISNSIFVGNQSMNGDMIDCWRGTLNIDSCTFTQNLNQRSLVNLENVEYAKITNSILHQENKPIHISGNARYTHLDVEYCNISGGYKGTGNIEDDPMFVDLGYWDDNNTMHDPSDDFWVGDYHLRSESPCINAGTPGSDFIDLLDMDKQPRVQYGRIDIGVDEYSLKPDHQFLGNQADITDLAIFADQWLAVDCNHTAVCAACDFNNDTKVNIEDFVLLSEMWRLDVQLAAYWNLNDNAETKSVKSSGWSIYSPAYAQRNTSDLTVAGVVFGALGFDGMEDYITAPKMWYLTDLPQASWGGWFRFDQLGTTMSLITDTTDGRAHGIHKWHNDYLYVYLGHPNNFVRSARITDTEWHHIMIVFDGTQQDNTQRLKVYVDGTNTIHGVNGNIPETVNLSTFQIGGLKDAGAHNWFPRMTGAADEIMIFTKALTPEQITQIYQQK